MFLACFSARAACLAGALHAHHSLRLLAALCRSSMGPLGTSILKYYQLFFLWAFSGALLQLFVFLLLMLWAALHLPHRKHQVPRQSDGCLVIAVHDA